MFQWTGWLSISLGEFGCTLDFVFGVFSGLDGLRYLSGLGG